VRDASLPLTQDELDTFGKGWSEGPVFHWFGFTLSYPNGDRSRITLPKVQHHHRGGLGTDAINGAVLAAMFDFAIGCTSLLATPLRKNATVQLSMAFERPVRGDSARCEAKIERATSNMLFVTAQMLDGADVICSRATGIVSLGPAVRMEDWMTGLVIDRGAKS
jgi:acyl-coenzyme A thioesterase PaaI-like protein